MGQAFENLTDEELCDLMCGDPEPEDNGGVYQCPNCGGMTSVWQADFDFEEMGYEGEGVVQTYHCTNCGAEIEYKVAEKQEDEE